MSGVHTTDPLTRVDVVGPMLAAASGDDRWRDCRADLIFGGKSNLTYTLSSAAGDLVLRRPPDGGLLATAHDMGREARVQRALAGTAVPVPEIVLTDDGGAIGVPFYVMAKVPGLVVRDRLPAGYAASADERRRLGLTLADTLADLHRIDPVEIGLGDYGRPAGFLKRQVRRWTRQWDASRTTPGAAVDALADRLARTVPAHSTDAVVHGDYRIDNCILAADDPGRIAAVLDWELSTLGDPLTDLGMLLFYWRDAVRMTPTLIQTVVDQPGFPSAEEIATRWAERTGLPLDDLDWYIAFAHFKFAVIAAGISARVRAGAMGGQDFGDLTGEIDATAESGLALTR